MSRPAWFIFGGVITCVVGAVVANALLGQLDADYDDPWKPRDR